MAILVTGGAGFVASNVIDRLLAGNEIVFAVDNLSLGSVQNLEHYRGGGSFRFIEADLADVDAYRAAIAELTRQTPIHEVWHLAANSDIRAGSLDSALDLRDTFMTTFNTVRLMDEFSIRRLIFASSSAVYGDRRDVELAEDSGPLLPISNYGAMKLASEALISAAAQRFMEKALIFRFPNVVGMPATHGIVLDLVNRLRTSPELLSVLGDGSQKKQYLHVTELVDAMMWCRDHGDRGLDVFNIGPDDSGVTVRQIAEEVVAAVAPEARIQFGVGKQGWIGDVPHFRYSIEKLKRLGWEPSLHSGDAVRRAIAEISQQGCLDGGGKF
jgi:UDP-glucose 4-epimerase